MLIHLRMQNIALIDDASLDFDTGLNVLTGETGAGKSILLDGINLALGSRANKELFRNGKEPAQVDLLFYEENPKILHSIQDLGIDMEDNEILLTRRFSTSGRSVCRINGQIVTAAQMKDAASSLIDIHGQHEHQSLMEPGRHRELLDRFDEKIASTLQEYQNAYHEYQDILDELERYVHDEQEKERLLSLMDYERNEIEEAALMEGEEEDLVVTRRRLYNCEKMQNAVAEAYGYLSEGTRGEGAALDLLDRAASMLQSIVALDMETLDPIASSLQDMLAIGEDLAHQLRDYIDTLEADPEQLSQIEHRLDLIHHLKSKYGSSVSAIQDYYENLLTEIDKLQNIQQTKERLYAQKLRCEEVLQRKAVDLHNLRTKAAKEIESEITGILATLQFNDPKFHIEIQSQDTFHTYGCDDIRFMIRTNVGDEMKPLNKIASGGEMSRIMLAIKTVLAKRDEISTLIFDEIDTGISGRTAQSVAEKMSQISVYHQVICITHLPQIAAMADAHYSIEKNVENGRTRTHVKRLKRDKMIEELARLMGGVTITDAVRQNAEEMKQQADLLKESLQ